MVSVVSYFRLSRWTKAAVVYGVTDAGGEGLVIDLIADDGGMVLEMADHLRGRCAPRRGGSADSEIVILPWTVVAGSSDGG